MDVRGRIVLVLASAGGLLLVATSLGGKPESLTPPTPVPQKEAEHQPSVLPVDAGVAPTIGDAQPVPIRSRGEFADPPTGDSKVGQIEGCALPEPRKFGRIFEGEPTVASEAIDRAGVARFVKVRLKSIQVCYERELRRRPELKGKVLVRFEIGPTGRVAGVEIRDDTLGSDGVANCIRSTIRTWTTPFHPAEPVPVTYPFVFTSEP